MFRLLLALICAFSLTFFLSTESREAWRKTVKGRVMSNVSMTLYWWIQPHFPFELVKDEDEWDAIGGDVFEKPDII
ncbi:uncharacterized protein LOC117139910 [Drosophila mauritiana]|uniref:Uncharacterized protein LOC117139910 n=1 Tax=Drosophila mauritiana TaxID=7226 RepID=A0A6P8JQS3_DROMA|nr:uncharacterized protein LOC117139910 [Drosophila mauritiana]